MSVIIVIEVLRIVLSMNNIEMNKIFVNSAGSMTPPKFSKCQPKCTNYEQIFFFYLGPHII
jgi:hypothetical protein